VQGQQQVTLHAAAEIDEEPTVKQEKTPARKIKTPRAATPKRGGRTANAGAGAPAAAAASPNAFPISVSAAVKSRAKLLFLELADVMQPEHLAPLSATVWSNWTQDQETPYAPTLGGTALVLATDAWKAILHEQLEKLDEQLFQFILDQAKVSSTVEQAVAMLGPRGGTKNAEWRRSYKEWKPPGKAVQLLWAYTNGVQPDAKHGSIFSMHCKGVWHGKRINSGFDVDDHPFSRSETASASAAAAAASPRAKAKPQPKKLRGSKVKRESASSVTTANKTEEGELEEAEADPSESAAPLEEDNTEVDLTGASEDEAAAKSVSNKRQKVPAAADASLRTPTRGGKRAAAAAAASGITTVPVASPTAASAPQAALQPMISTATPVATPIAAATVAVAAPAASASLHLIAQPAPPTAAALVAAPAAAVTGEMTAVTAVLQAMQAQTTQFLASQQRSEERAEAANRAASESHMEMLRLAQSGQQSIMELVRKQVQQQAARADRLHLLTRCVLSRVLNCCRCIP
jgi:hypothetical protein